MMPQTARGARKAGRRRKTRRPGTSKPPLNKRRPASGARLRSLRRKRRRGLRHIRGLRSVRPAAVREEEIQSRILEAVQQAEALKYGQGHRAGYKQGLYDGGDGLVDQSLPQGYILPEVSVHEIIQAGIERMKDRLYPVMNTQEVTARMREAMDGKQPLAVVRLGDGELLTMAQDVLMGVEQVREEGPFLPYAGVNLPDYDTRDRLMEALGGPTIVGIPLLRVPNFQPLAMALFRARGIDYRSLALTHSTINYAMYLERALPGILAGRRVLVVGNKAPELAAILLAGGVDVVGAVAPVHGTADIPRVMGEIAAHDFDLALVSAGISAVILCHRIAVELGRVALDFGHLADSMVRGDAPYA